MGYSGNQDRVCNCECKLTSSESINKLVNIPSLNIAKIIIMNIKGNENVSQIEISELSDFKLD